MKEGAFGCTISGAGPTIVAICDDAEKGKKIAKAMMAAFKESGKLEVRERGEEGRTVRSGRSPAAPAGRG